MARKGTTPEKIIGLLRQVEVETGESCRGLGMSCQAHEAPTCGLPERA
jgi:hypothetical protein